MFSPQIRIVGALGCGLLLVVGAYITKQRISSPSEGQVAIVAESPTRTFIPVNDSVGDGIPDWQRSLVRTEILPNKLTSTSTWSPSTVTEKFSVLFFESMLRNETYGPFSRDREELIGESTDILAQQVQQDRIFFEKDIIIGPEGDQETLRRYVNSVADIMLKHSYQGDSEMVILERALRNNDPNILSELQPILRAYESMVLDMQRLSVPQQLVFEHLDLLNSYHAIKVDITIMTEVFKDPLLTLMRIKRYEDDVYAMTKSIMNIYTKVVGDYGVQFTNTDKATAFMATIAR